MNFRLLTVHNFFRCRHVVFDLSRGGITYVEGRNLDVGKSNESGKTTLFFALSWCLYGRFPGGGGRIGDEVVNPLVGNDCYVELEVFDGDDKFIIRRTRKEGPKHDQSNLYVAYKGSRTDIEKEKTFPLSQKDMVDSTKYVVNLVGMDFDSFTKQVYFAPEGVEFVSRMKDAALKAFFLESVLNIEWTQNALVRAKNEKGRLEALIVQQQTLRDASKRLMKTYFIRLQEYRHKVVKWEEEEAVRKAGLKEQLVEALTLIDEASAVNKKVEKAIKQAEVRYQKLEKQLNKQLATIPTPQNLSYDSDRLEKLYRKQSAEYTLLVDSRTRTAGRIASLEERVRNAESHLGQPCASCGTVITQEHIPWMVKEIEAELTQLHENLLEVESRVGEAQLAQDATASELEQVKAKNESQRSEYGAKADLQVQLARLEVQKQTELRELRDEMLDVNGVEKEVEGLKRGLAEEATNPFTSLVVNEKEQLLQAAVESRAARKKIEALREEVKKADFWIRGFSGNGIQSYLLSAVTPILNRNIGVYMQDLAHGRIAVRLHTVKKLKSGDYRENFHVEITNHDGGRTFTSLSSGAKRRVDLAVALAVADYKRSLSHKNLKLLVLDEMTSAMDAYWEQQFLKLVRKNFATHSCFLISHKEVDNSMYDHKLTVIKKNGETKLEEI